MTVRDKYCWCGTKMKAPKVTRHRDIGGFRWTATSIDGANWIVTTHRGNSFAMGGDFSDWPLITT